MMSRTDFRNWIDRVWQENCTERELWHEPPLSKTEYFNQFKWLLKRQFRTAMSATTHKE